MFADNSAWLRYCAAMALLAYSTIASTDMMVWGPARFHEALLDGEATTIAASLSRATRRQWSADEIKTRGSWSFTGRGQDVRFNVVVAVENTANTYQNIMCRRDDDWRCVAENEAIAVGPVDDKHMIWLDADVPTHAVRELVIALRTGPIIDQPCTREQNTNKTHARISVECEITSEFLTAIERIRNFGLEKGHAALSELRKRNTGGLIVAHGSVITADDVVEHPPAGTPKPETKSAIVEPVPYASTRDLPGSVLRSLKTRHQLDREDVYLELEGNSRYVVVRRAYDQGRPTFEIVENAIIMY